MSTPERPSLADTIARIDAALADLETSTAALKTTTAEAQALLAEPAPCLKCARQALLGSPYCAAHKRIPREMIEDLGPDAPVAEPVTRDGNTFTVNQPGWYQIGSRAQPDPELVRQGVVDAIARGDVHRAARQSAAQLAATAARINAAPPKQQPATQPERGWLARALNRLFT